LYLSPNFCSWLTGYVGVRASIFQIKNVIHISLLSSHQKCASIVVLNWLYARRMLFLTAMQMWRNLHAARLWYRRCLQFFGYDTERMETNSVPLCCIPTTMLVSPTMQCKQDTFSSFVAFYLRCWCSPVGQTRRDIIAALRWTMPIALLLATYVAD
jgi:hypothetical protein